jgi:hypothetical protein
MGFDHYQLAKINTSGFDSVIIIADTPSKE